MSENISTHRKLLVVSDTAMYRKKNQIIGFEPVVRELDSISQLFDEVVWLGYLYREKINGISAIKPLSKNVKLIPMPMSGGNGIIGKVKVILFYPIYLFYILRNLFSVTHIHSRAPSHPATLAMLISKFNRRKIFWHKYAGNWVEPSPPRSYAYQIKLLKSISRKGVFGTINGKWQNQEEHLISFENPCLSMHELEIANQFRVKKSFEEKLILIFVGNLTESKGILNLVAALNLINDENRFEHLYIVGDGELKGKLVEELSSATKIKFSVLGALNRSKLNQYYKIAHINILPSKTEGFPKVIAEGAAYGCIPLVSDISSIGQYVKDNQNGFLLSNNLPLTIAQKLNTIANHTSLVEKSINAFEMSKLFTYDHFKNKIMKNFISDFV